MFEHLMSPEFDDLSEVDAHTLLAAQAGTADSWFTQMGSPEHVLTDAGRDAARRAFATVLRPDAPDAEKKASILALRVPEAVKHLAGMLSQYDWDYVEQAKELRGYVVANLLEESKSPDSRVRLRALELIGKLSEVASFSERIEVVHKTTSTDELQESIRAKLQSLLPKVIEVQDVTPIKMDALDVEIQQVAPVRERHE